MKWTGLNELRESYLSFFESKGHLRLPSFSLIPDGDKSLLLINSGMAPMKPYFQGTKVPPRRRVTTCQKCIRTPDLENVGKTARHGTYFEMLGNFSFGDYFKNEAIEWAWEFLTKTLEIPEALLWPSVYEKDDEAYSIWRDKIGVPEERIVKLGKADNFWEHGSGPCGPCSEIYFDRGEKYGCGSPDCRPGCECDRYMEIWNNVFSQFDNDGQGNYTELSQKNIDTGMGLERLACVLQGVDNLFEVDTVRKILDTVCEYAGKKYGEEYSDDVSIRIITDHIRSSSFMICDGVIPSNEGRGYVLRRLIRRACRNGRLLGIKRAFLAELCDVVIGENEGAYPALREKADYIKKILSTEEQNFDKTIDKGLEILGSMIEELEKEGKIELSGENLFRLYDTYGFPADLVTEILEEKGLTANTEEFKACMDKQKKTARERMRDNGGWKKEDAELLLGIEKTEFLGYEKDICEAKVAAIIKNGALTGEASGEATVILDKTVFYGEGGGQVGDTGRLTVGDIRAVVTDTKKSDGIYMHVCDIEAGLITVGMTIKAQIDTERRSAIIRNHSSVHLLQAALREVLGSHVQQAGSYVDEKVARFDFNHFSAMTPEEIDRVEALVNKYILEGNAIETVETDIESARKMGAMALFGEKYGDRVRVVKMGERSCELCGGTHLKNTAGAGLFKIISESSVAAGVRRIEAVTGENFLSYVKGEKELIEETARILKTQNSAEIAAKAQGAMAEIKALRSKIDSQSAELASQRLASVEAGAEIIGKFRVITERIDGMDAASLRSAGDILKDKYSDVVAILASVDGEKISFVSVCGKDAQSEGAHAGKLVGIAAKLTLGGGGGRSDSATAGGKDSSKLDAAFAAVKEELKKMQN